MSCRRKTNCVNNGNLALSSSSLPFSRCTLEVRYESQGKATNCTLRFQASTIQAGKMILASAANKGISVQIRRSINYLMKFYQEFHHHACVQQEMEAILIF